MTVDEIDLGVFDLQPGAHRIEVEIMGCNREALKRYMFGLDYLRLEKEP